MRFQQLPTALNLNALIYKTVKELLYHTIFKKLSLRVHRKQNKVAANNFLLILTENYWRTSNAVCTNSSEGSSRNSDVLFFFKELTGEWAVISRLLISSVHTCLTSVLCWLVQQIGFNSVRDSSSCAIKQVDLVGIKLPNTSIMDVRSLFKKRTEKDAGEVREGGEGSASCCCCREMHRDRDGHWLRYELWSGNQSV